jgi:hypothetical protein
VLGKSIRTLALMVALPAVATARQAPASLDVYRTAVASYLKNGDSVGAVAPMLGWRPEDLQAVIDAIVRRNDPAELEAAAALHLEIGVVSVGLSMGVAVTYLEHGSRLIDTVLPPPAMRRGLSAGRIAEINRLRAAWHRAAASVYLSVNDIARARPLVSRAQSIEGRSAETLTLAGIIEELDAGTNDPDDWDVLLQRTRSDRMRASLLLRAEKSYKNALDADPSYALARIRLGRVQHLLDYPRPARESLERGAADAKEPRHQFLAAMFMGELQRSQNDYPAARRSFEQALAISPQSQSAVVALSFTELMLGRTDRAREIAQGFTSAPTHDEWWAYKSGLMDIEGLRWIFERIRK